MSHKKPKSCVWEYFTINNNNKGDCNYCQTSISKTAARLKHHIPHGCTKAPESVKLMVMRENNRVIFTVSFVFKSLFQQISHMKNATIIRMKI